MKSEIHNEATRCTTSDKRHGNIIVAEDDAEMRALIAVSLRSDGYRVVECRDGLELLDHLQASSQAQGESVDLIVSDIRMPGVSGLAVLQDLRRQRDPPPMILITAFGDSETHAEAKRLGAAGLLDKPFHVMDLLAIVREILPP